MEEKGRDRSNIPSETRLKTKEVRRPTCNDPEEEIVWVFRREGGVRLQKAQEEGPGNDSVFGRRGNDAKNERGGS